MSREEYHVTPKGDNWQVKKAGADRASSKASTQKEAKRQAKKFAKGSGARFTPMVGMEKSAKRLMP